MDAEITLLLSNIDLAYEKKAWHGPNLRGSLKGVTAEIASWRPAKGRHNIWELVIHAAYWKYTVRRRLTGEKRGSFPIKGSNWFERTSSGDEREWKNDLRLLDEAHRSMREAVTGVRKKDLDVIPPGTKSTNVRTVLGVAAHDLYHAGQIQLLKRLHESRRR
jgi:hypothetical protein